MIERTCSRQMGTKTASKILDKEMKRRDLMWIGA
jgi:hypothetical protein